LEAPASDALLENGGAPAKSSRSFLKSKLPKLGLKEFWYPAAKSKAIGEKPTAVKLVGEEIAIYRDGGKVYAVHNRCPHRGMPMSAGKRNFPGTISCAYHGWTFGTDVPASRPSMKARVRACPGGFGFGPIPSKSGTG
jgi:phenylpropionate dioxygenase-like ring-hydroxylating dioxygenase large terminal subunit